MPKAVWARVLAELGSELDYVNFKSEVAESQGTPGRHYVDALHKVWAVMCALQEARADDDSRG